MQIVIDIPDTKYTVLKNIKKMRSGGIDDYYKAILDGTPLPKGHGRLIDADIFIHEIVKYSHQSTKTIGTALSDTPTVLEADKGSAE